MYNLLGASIDVSYPPVPRILGISSHGVFAGLGIGVAVWLLVRRLQHRSLPVDPVYKAVMWGIIAAIIGARADYVISHRQSYTSAADVVALQNGGLALFGGLIAGTVTAAVILFRHGAPVVASLDAAAPCFSLAIAIGRVGDLLLLDHLGRPLVIGAGIGYRIPVGAPLAPGFAPTPAVLPSPGQTCNDLATFYAGCTYHLTAGYDLIGAAVLTVLLLFLSTKGPPPGRLFMIFALLYGAQRLLLDFTRGIDERPLLGLTGTQLLSLIVLLASATLLTWQALTGHRTRARRAGPEDL